LEVEFLRCLQFSNCCSVEWQIKNEKMRK
jgi:hypothetical protein